MNIRLARRDDLPGILEISNWAAMNTPANFAIEPEPLVDWQRAFDETHAVHPWYVAAQRDDIVGFARSSPWKGRCAYAHSVETTVYVHRDCHRHGIGRALYGRLLPTLESQGYRSLVGGITLPNDASVALHESFGFRQVACFDRIGFKFCRWHDVGYWMKHVGGDGAPSAILTVEDVVAQR